MMLCFFRISHLGCSIQWGYYGLWNMGHSLRAMCIKQKNEKKRTFIKCHLMTCSDIWWHIWTLHDISRILTYKKDISDTMKKKTMYFRRRKGMIFGQQKSKLCFMQRSHENKLGNFFGKKMKNVVDLGICLPCQFWHFYSTQLGQKIENAKKNGKTCTWLSGNDPYFKSLSIECYYP